MARTSGRLITWLGGISLLGLAAGGAQAQEAQSPCAESLNYLTEAYLTDPATQAAFQATFEGLHPLPPGITYNGSAENPWATAGSGEGLFEAVRDFYAEVCTLLPQIVGNSDNALDSIQYFAWLYYRNEAGVHMVSGIDPNDPEQQLHTVANFLIRFNEDYYNFMNSADSTTYVPEWIADPRIEIEDYVYRDPSDYDSWNEFFARNLQFDPETGTYPSRPVTMPDRSYVVVSPTDCIMNPLVQVVDRDPGPVTRQWIENPLQLDTVLDVKGIPMSVDELLANAPQELKDLFAGSTGLACVLMPNTYHHFHSPVDGVIEYWELVEAEPDGGNQYAYGTFGYSDWPNWVPFDGNVGRPGTDFSQFQGFQRGVIIIRVTYDGLPGEELTGYVASIPVGLDTVGSVVLSDEVANGATVTKGVTPFGNFYFGGSLNILLFSPIQGAGEEGDPVPMLAPAVQTRMGNQIGILNTPQSPPETPWTPD
jgi:phosphatidylserine decarboxylase